MNLAETFQDLDLPVVPQSLQTLAGCELKREVARCGHVAWLVLVLVNKMLISFTYEKNLEDSEIEVAVCLSKNQHYYD